MRIVNKNVISVHNKRKLERELLILVPQTEPFWLFVPQLMRVMLIKGQLASVSRVLCPTSGTGLGSPKQNEGEGKVCYVNPESCN